MRADFSNVAAAKRSHLGVGWVLQKLILWGRNCMSDKQTSQICFHEVRILKIFPVFFLVPLWTGQMASLPFVRKRPTNPC